MNNVAPFDHACQGERTDRQVPANIEVEQAFLGALLVNNDVLAKVLAFLEPEHFFEDIHSLTYEVAAAMIRGARRPTPSRSRPS
jgi:replicative DNA helicase